MTDARIRLVWVVEDEEHDLERALGVLDRYSVPHQEFDRAIDALAELEQPERLRPSFVLLDWRLAGGGESVLRTIRKLEHLRQTPVVVFSRSREDIDVRAAFTGCANAYVVKPDDFDEYESKLVSIFDFFLRISESPQHD